MLPLLVFLVVVETLLQDVSAASAKLPSDFQYCKRSDPEITKCLQRVILPALVSLRNGIPALKIPSMDPLEITAINVEQGQGPVSIGVKFTNGVVKGSSSPIIESGEVDLSKFFIKYTGVMPHVEFEADYEMTGKVLLLPVTGKGRCKLIFTNMHAKIGPIGNIIQKKGKDYVDVQDFESDLYNVEKFQVNFENLFNGDKTLGNSMNTLLNENSKDLFEELKPAFIATFKSIFHQYSKGIFDKVPLDDIFEK